MWFPQPSVTGVVLEELAAAWRIWLPCLILLVWLGLYQRTFWSGRLLLLTVASLVCFGGWIAKQDNARERAAWVAWDARRVPLKQAITLDGLHLPAGTLVRWNTEDPTHVVTADLIGEQEVAPGIVLRGEIVYWGLWWRGELAHDTTLPGWSCKAGKEVDLEDSGKLRWCVPVR